MRRNQSTLPDPEVETSRAELEHIEGEKVAKQGEVTAIAENKKALEASYEVRKMKLEDELINKQQEVDRQIAKIDQLVKDAETRAANAEKRADEAEAAAKISEARASAFKADNVALEAAQKDVSESYMQLTRQKIQLENDVRVLDVKIKASEERNAVLAASIVEAETNLVKMKSEGVALGATNARLSTSNEVLDYDIGMKKKELNDVIVAHEEKSRQLNKASDDLLEIQKKQSDHEAAMQKREGEANSRLGNATLLEQRVDGKLVQLKEAEKQFTIEHLGRMGYKPIGTT